MRKAITTALIVMYSVLILLFFVSLHYHEPEVKPVEIIPCDTDTDCQEKNPHILEP